MALLHCEFYSKAIGKDTSMDVILPQLEEDGDFQTLYLLHGYSDNSTAWQRRTNIERYAAEYKLAIVMPDAQMSFYSNFLGIKNGYRYWDFISDELLSVTRRLFHLSDKREDTFVAGLSMGGFGAFKCALNCPEKFAAAASLSGAVDSYHLLSQRQQPDPELSMFMESVENLKGSINDLYTAAKKTSELPAEQRPKLYQACGTEDFLHKDNIHYRDFITDLNAFDYTYEEGPGTHEWAFWDNYIQRVLKWLPLEKTIS
jgi:S-formylglutathione hydrolase FrmB